MVLPSNVHANNIIVVKSRLLDTLTVLPNNVYRTQISIKQRFGFLIRLVCHFLPVETHGTYICDQIRLVPHRQAWLSRRQNIGARSLIVKVNPNLKTR